MNQKDDFGRRYVVAYTSQNNNTAEANFSSYDGETLAAVWAFVHFQPYLYSHHFALMTDHQPLWWHMESDKLTGKLARWALLLQECNFEVVHRARVTNLDADGLSRNPSPSDENLTGPSGMEIVIERRFQVGAQLLTSLYCLAWLLKFRYKTRMMRLIDLKLLRIYGRIFPYCIVFSMVPFLCLPRQWKGIRLDIK